MSPAREPYTGGDTVTLLAVELGRIVNDSQTICHALVKVIEQRLWEPRGFKTLRELIEAPHSQNGLASTIHRLNAYAMAQPWAAKAFYTVAMAEGWDGQIIADVKAAQAKVKLDAIKPAMTPQEKTSRAGKARRRDASTPPRSKSLKREDMNLLRYRVANPDHPKHKLAKELMVQVERGELSPGSARKRMDDAPELVPFRRAKINVRKLTPEHRAEFFQWLLNQGAVLALTPNPSFNGFTDGRKPKPP